MTGKHDDELVRGYHDWNGDRSIATAVVRAVAATLDAAPSQIEPVSDVVDTDALEALFSPRSEGSPRDEGSVSFTFEGCDVTVHADGEIVVRPAE